MKKFNILVLFLAIFQNIYAFSLKIGDIYYNLDNENLTAEVTYESLWSDNNYDNLKSGVVIIPDSLYYFNTYYKVTSIGYGAFSYCKKMGAILLPPTIQTIGEYAFLRCSNLTTINIPSSVNEIGFGGFEKCESLETVDITDFTAWCKIKFHDSSSNPLTYAHRLMKNNKEITIIDFPAELNEVKKYAFTGGYFNKFTYNSDILSIGDYAFENCLTLTDIELPPSLKRIGERAFEECRSLKEITIPDAVEDIGGFAFQRCMNLEKVRLPENLTEIKEHTFSDCSSLFDIMIPSKVTKIKRGAFYGCKSLTEINLPDALTEIGGWAFNECYYLKDLRIGNSLSKIDQNAFSYCDRLENLYINDLEKWFRISFENEYSNPLFYAKYIYLNGELITDLKIPESVYRIKPYTFYGSPSIITLSLHRDMGSIADYAFAKCTSLETIYCEFKPGTGNINIFPSSIYDTATLVVPEGNGWGLLYRERSPWKYFSNIIDYPYAGINNAISESEKLYTVYSSSGMLILKDAEKENLSNLSPGLYIINGKKTLIK